MPVAPKPLHAPLRVELVGLPGAGKSTLVAAVIERLRARGLRCADRGSREALLAEGFRAQPRLVRALRWLGFLARERRLGAHLLRYSLGFWPPRARGVRQVYVLLQSLRNQRLLDRRLRRGLEGEGVDAPEGGRSADVVLLDQGLLHGIWCISYLRPGPPAARLAAALRRLPPPDLAIAVDVSGSRSIRRMAERRQLVGPTGEVDRMTDLRPTDLDVSGAHCRQIVELASELGLTEHLILDGERPVEALAAQVEERILALLKRHRPEIEEGPRAARPS